MSTDNRSMTVRDWLAVFGGALGAFMAILDIQVTNASLRDISGSLSLSVTESGWISTGYLIAEIIIIPLSAFLSQVFGIKRYILVNCVIFLIASILCGLSNSLTTMVLCRALQGFSGGTLIPLSFQIILTQMPERLKHIGLTIFGLTVTLAPTLGPSLGGWLTDEYGWRSIFFINVVPGFIMIFALNMGLEYTKTNIQRLKEIDLFSVVTLVFGLSSMTYLLEEGPKQEWFDSTAIRACLILTIICIPSFIVRQFTTKHPLLRLSLFGNRNFALGTIITAVAGCALFSGIYSLSLYLSQVQDYSSKEIGAVLMWVGLPQLIIMPALPFLMKRVDMRILAIIGLLLFAYSNFLNTGLNVNFTGEDLKFSLLIRALGQPLFVIPLSAMAMALVKKEEAADGSSIFNVMRNLGASVGIALTTTFLITQQSGHLIQMSEKISAYDNALVEKYYLTEKEFKSQGMDAATARSEAAKVFVNPLVRDSMILSFIDIFSVLGCALIACAGIILCLKKTEATGEGTEEAF